LTAQTIVTSSFAPADPYRVLVDLPLAGGAQGPVSPSVDAAIVAPPPHVVGIVQQADKDLSRCAGIPLGRVLAVLFSSEVTPESVQDRRAASDISNYAMLDNRIVGVALQPGRRIAFIGLRDGVGPFVPRSLSIANVMDNAGRTMATETMPVFFCGRILNRGAYDELATQKRYLELKYEGDAGLGDPATR